MKQIDEIFTESPEYGSRKIRDILRSANRSKKINRKRVQRLMWLRIIEGHLSQKKSQQFMESVSILRIYNSRRPHDPLGKRTPDEVYLETFEYGLNQNKIS